MLGLHVLKDEVELTHQCYFFDSDIGNFHYGPGHPMKPTRIRMCHALVMNYGLYKNMEIFVSDISASHDLPLPASPGCRASDDSSSDGQRGR